MHASPLSHEAARAGADADPTAAVPFRDALRAWVRVAVQSFGGPAGQIAVIHRIVVDEKRWLDERRFLEALGYCMLLPGPEAQQLATYVGWKLHGVRGGLVAGCLFILPGFLSILALSVVYARFGSTPALEAAFYGLKPAVIAIVLAALWRLGGRALRDRPSQFIAAAAFLSMAAFDVPFPLVIAAAALAGAVFESRSIGPSAAHAMTSSGAAGASALRRRTALTVATWLAIWLAPVAALVGAVGTEHVLAREALFFSRSAVVTFGGAYAVLAYVAQQAVDVYAWVTPAEMLDGLGLAESTPGPLIQVVQFVGFLGAYRHVTGVNPYVAGVLGAGVTTWVTFAPCFLFIFAGAPYIDDLHRRPRLRGALAGITAAVVGVILNLTLWFSLHTLFAATRDVEAGPLQLLVPVWSSIDPGATSIAAVAIAATFRWRAPMGVTLVGGVLLGILAKLVS
jgi:chromate transporter